MSPSSDSVLRLKVAARAAQAAGVALRYGIRSDKKAIRMKFHPNDPVTEYDLRADAVIVEAIRATFPRESVLTEEREGESLPAGTGWVVDPLDGTNNFTRGLPHFAVSIAYCERSLPRVACILDPVRQELFTAARGEGAQKDGHPCRVSSHAGLDGAVLAVGTSIHPALRQQIHDKMPRFIQAARALRTTGSAALDLAYVACGRFDAVWYPRLFSWDIAAGILLIEEAGGRISDYEGNGVDASAASIVASNGRIHDSVLEELS